MTDINGYDRVTNILFAFSGLTVVDPHVLQRAADRGTFVHDTCDLIINDLPTDDIPEDFQGYIDSFKLWAEGKTFLPKPDRFFCDDLMITGECDGIYEQDGIVTLFDLKTPLREGKTWGMQGSAYAYLAKHYGHKIDKVEFVKLDKGGKAPKAYIYPDTMQDFLICLAVFRKYFKNQTTEINDF